MIWGVNRNELNSADDQFGRKNVGHEKEVLAPGGTIPCRSPQNEQKPAEKAILYFFGSGMMIGPDKGDVSVPVDFHQAARWPLELRLITIP